MTSRFSLLMSQTHINSASRCPLKNFSRILLTTARADFRHGTAQFSMSQNTPIGGRASDRGCLCLADIEIEHKHGKFIHSSIKHCNIKINLSVTVLIKKTFHHKNSFLITINSLLLICRINFFLQTKLIKEYKKYRLMVYMPIIKF